MLSTAMPTQASAHRCLQDTIPIMPRRVNHHVLCLAHM